MARKLESDQSQAAKTTAAQHDDELSPGKIVQDRADEGPSQRIGDNTVSDNPVTSFPDESETAA